MPTDHVVTLFAQQGQVDSTIQYTIKRAGLEPYGFLLVGIIVVAGIVCLALLAKQKP